VKVFKMGPAKQRVGAFLNGNLEEERNNGGGQDLGKTKKFAGEGELLIGSSIPIT